MGREKWAVARLALWEVGAGRRRLEEGDSCPEDRKLSQHSARV